MTCSVCGKPYPCPHSRRSASALLEATVAGSAEVAAASSAPNLLSPTELLDRSERERWRREVISRVQQHRARRRRFDPNASLELGFPAEDTTTLGSQAAEAPALPPQEDDSATTTGRLEPEPARSRPPKIIRFPRQSAVESTITFRPTQADQELAEPVLDTPRILDTPEHAPQAEQMELLQSFADIHLEPPEPNLNTDIDLPLATASLSRRAFSGAMDGAIVLTACAMFAVTFVKLAETVPASRVGWLYALAVGAAIWLMFQYIFLVYGRGTPGMRALSLELCNFTGRRASRFARRCRAMATVLSGLSLGLGFAWTLVDEDTLGWHDRISGTYMRNSPQPSAFF